MFQSQALQRAQETLTDKRAIGWYVPLEKGVCQALWEIKKEDLVSAQKGLPTELGGQS